MKNIRTSYTQTVRANQMKPAFVKDGEYYVVFVADPKEVVAPCDPKLWAEVEDPKTGYDLKTKTRFLGRLDESGRVVHIDMYPDNSVMHQFKRSDLEGRTTADLRVNSRGDIEVIKTPDGMRRAEVLELFIDALASAKKWPLRSGDLLKSGNAVFRVKRADGDTVELEPTSLDIYKQRQFNMSV